MALLRSVRPSPHSADSTHVDRWRHRGVVLSPAVIPIALTVTWSKLTRAGVFCGCIIGAVLGMLAWMIGCWKIFGASQSFPFPTSAW